MTFPFRFSMAPLLWLALLLNLSLLTPAAAELYRLGPGDTVKIYVFQEPGLSVQAKISAGGVIDYPLIGELKIAGRTLAEAEELLDQKLRGDYLIDPQISISMVSFRTFFITGAVNSPGSYEYQPGMTIRQAIAIAGDFTARASRNKVFVIKEDDANNTSTKTPLDVRVSPGDVITVKESFF